MVCQGGKQPTKKPTSQAGSIMASAAFQPSALIANPFLLFISIDNNKTEETLTLWGKIKYPAFSIYTIKFIHFNKCHIDLMSEFTWLK